MIVSQFYFVLSQYLVLQKQWEELVNFLKESNDNYMEELEKNQGQLAPPSRSRWFDQINKLLRYSGYAIRYPWITPTVFLFVLLFIAPVGFILTLFIKRNLLLSIFVLCCLIIIPIAFLKIKTDKNYVQVEQQLANFLNLVGSYSTTNVDLITILSKTSMYLAEPLVTPIHSAVLFAKNTGALPMAMKQLEDSLEHPIFKKMIKSLEICSRNGNSYQEVVNSFRPQVERFIRNSTKGREIFRGGRNTIFIIIFLCLVLVYVSLDSFYFKGNTEITFTKVIELFCQGFLGVFILVGAVILVIVTTFFMIFKKTK